MQFLQKLKHHQIPQIKHEVVDPRVSIVLVHGPLAPDLSAFLDKMVSAFEWGTDSCFHLEIHPGLGLDYSGIWAGRNLRLVLCFGISAGSLGLFLPDVHYQLLNMAPFNVYMCDTLEKIANRKELKSKLWQDLKALKSVTPE